MNNQWINIINNGLDGISYVADLIQKVWFLFAILVSAIIYFITFVRFKHKCKKNTKQQINQYSSSGKYIKGLFVELNDTKECIRAFCFSRKWKKKIIKKFNSLFNNKRGDEISKVYPKYGFKTKIVSCISIKNTAKYIHNNSFLLKKIKKRELKYNSEFEQTNVWYECFAYEYERRLKNIQKMVDCLKADYMVLSGRAGNGKSVMLCSVAEMLTANKKTVLFLNARDIQGDVDSYLANLFLSKNKQQHFFFWWNIKAVLYKILRKKIYILIDAINENDNDSFLKTFSRNIEKIIKIGSVKVIVSCRSEYYDMFYKDYLISPNLEKRVCLLNLQEEEYSDIAFERMISNYRKHYNFKGEISKEVKEKLSNQLLLVKILFETYEGKTDNIYELNKYELYNKYMRELDDSKLRLISKRLAKEMLSSNKFENIPIERIGMDTRDYETVDSSILVCRNIIKNENTLREELDEVINYVYDEMRDYAITKQLLKECENDLEEIDDQKIKNYIEPLSSNHAKCFEGVISYLFDYYYSENNEEMLEYLLFKYIKDRDLRLDEFRNRGNKGILSWGLKLLFETGAINTEIGQKYVDFILDENPSNEAKRLLSYLIKQELINGQNNLDILLKAIIRSESKGILISRIKNTLADWKGEGVTVGELEEIDKKIVKVNKRGAVRFESYVNCILTVFDWDEKKKVMEYFEDESDLDLEDEFFVKVRSALNENDKVQ